MMKRVFSIPTLLSFLLAGCVTTAPVVTSRVDQGSNEPPAGYYYSLPRTVLRIDFQLCRRITIPGPYSQYASKYLGITDVATTGKTEWSITGATITNGTESDPQNLYCIQPALMGTIMLSLSALTQQGFILTPGLVFAPGSSERSDEDALSGSAPLFTDLSTSRYFSENIDTLYKTMFKDSMFVRVPVIKKEIEQKTPEMKAQEAANFIIRIRKRRFKLLSGQYNFITEGAALEVTVRELGKLEEAYLSLFIGKQIMDNKTVSYYYIPDKAAEGRADILCRFSEESGIHPAAEKQGQPVVIRVLDENNAPDTPGTALNSISNAIYYRIPGTAAVSVAFGEIVIAERRLSIFQFGPTLTLPLPQAKKHIL